MNKQNKKRLIERENILMVVRDEGVSKINIKKKEFALQEKKRYNKK